MGNTLTRVAVGRTSEPVTAKELSFGVSEFRARKYDFGIYYAENKGDPQANQLAGWLRSIEDTPDGAGLLWGQAEFTDEARQSVAAGKYTHLEPIWLWSFAQNGSRQGMSLVGAVLTPAPFQDRSYVSALDRELPPITLAAASNTFNDGHKGGIGQETGKPKRTILNDLGMMDKFIGGIIEDLIKEQGMPYNQALREVWRTYPQVVRLREALYQKRETG